MARKHVLPLEVDFEEGDANLKWCGNNNTGNNILTFKREQLKNMTFCRYHSTIAMIILGRKYHHKGESSFEKTIGE
jgi:hypothetical protein